MPEGYLDFRSDTVTRPTSSMRAAMASAPVGDDVFGEDPTVNRLQQRVAEVLGKEAALFVPSGTMSNQIGLRLHCKPGEEMICEAECHLYYYEQAGYAQLSGIAARPVPGVYGVIEVEQLQGLVRPENPHFVRTRLVCLENTHNRGGGRIQPYATVEAICRWARANGLAAHLDALIAEAVRHRKVLGGGMRQAGILAAAALYALEHHVDRLAEDHANAQRLADAIRQIPALALRPETVDTNLVFFTVDPAWGTAPEFSAELKQRGVLMNATGPTTLRAATHLDVSRADVDRAITIVDDVARRRK